MDSYMVRIYRRVENDPNKLVGIVREIGTEEKKAFKSLDELWSILNPRKMESTQTKKPKAANGADKNGL